MKRRISLLLLLSIVLPACLCSVPTIAPTIISTSTPEEIKPSPTLLPTIQPGGEIQNTPGATFTIVSLDPNQGELNTQLRAEAIKAANLGQRAVVEFTALW